MAELQFDKYKPNLKDILRYYGKDPDRNPMFCINPEHENTDTPAMLIYDTHYECKSCGVKGDIYDAIELISGITDRVEQYRKVEEILGKASFKKGERSRGAVGKFIPDKTALKKIAEYVKKQGEIQEKKIIEYLKKRRCTPEMIRYISPGLGWWPGHKEAEKDLSKDVLWNAGIPGMNPKTKKYSWGPAGVVVKLATGFKLLYYDEKGKSQKIGTKTCEIFPAFMPSELKKSNALYLTEGEMSALAMKSAGYKDVCPTGGVNGIKTSDRKKIEPLLSYDEIYIVYDGDTAGKKSIHGVKDNLRAAGVDGDIYIVRLPPGTDPDDLIKEGKKEILDSAIEKSREKLGEIKKAIERKEEKSITHDPKNDPFYFAGYDEKNYYVVPKNQSIPIAVGRSDGAIRGMLFDFAPYEYWSERFWKEKGDDIVFDMNAAVEWFRQRGQKSGLYDQNDVLGVGPHIDEGKIIFNLGDGLYLFEEKKRIEYTEYTGKKFYMRSTDSFDLSGKPWNLQECLRLYAEIKKYGFLHNIDFMLVAGWIVLAPFASILDRRPHIAITGQKGSGKTTFIDNIVNPAIGDFAISVEGLTSEAGARQRIGKDCRPVIVDEFEANNQEKKKRVEGILSLARSAFGGTAETIKGQQNQKALVFRTKVMFMFLAVKIDLLNDANRSRIPVLELRNLNAKLETNFDFAGLRKRTFENLDRILELTKQTREYMKNFKYDNRTLDTYSTLLAGFWFLVSEADFLKDEYDKKNEAVENAIVYIEQKITEEEKDEVMILNYIFDHRVRLGPESEMTIYELIVENKIDPDGYEKIYDGILARYGIRRDPEMTIEGKTYNALAIAGHHLDLEKILKDTEFFDYKDILKRHPAAIFDEQKSIRMGKSKKQRCIVLDWEIITEYHVFDEEKEIPF